MTNYSFSAIAPQVVWNFFVKSIGFSFVKLRLFIKLYNSSIFYDTNND
jgi:hypothetical protein